MADDQVTEKRDTEKRDKETSAKRDKETSSKRDKETSSKRDKETSSRDQETSSTSEHDGNQPSRKEPQAKRKEQDGRARGHGLSRDAIEQAKEQLAALIGRPVEGVIGMERTEDGGWSIAVQVLELERIPNSTDICGKYEMEVSEDGELMGVQRTARYYRCQAGED